MPDIAMCRNTDCPMRDKCLRFTATPSERQAYVRFEPAKGADRCDRFWRAIDVPDATGMDAIMRVLGVSGEDEHGH